MMNSDEQWLLYLWSGTFASAVGGAVAVLVLWRTNRNQVKLSDKARDEASRDAGRLLSQQQSLAQGQIQAQRAAQEKLMVEQRRLSASETKAAEERADKALKAQRDGLELQLNEQRQEAFRSRERAAIADMVAASDNLNDSYRRGLDELREDYRRLNAAMRRWEIEHVNFNNSAGMRWQAANLFEVACKAYSAWSIDESDEAGHLLSRATTEFSMKWSRYPSASPEDQRTHLEWVHSFVRYPAASE